MQALHAGSCTRVLVNVALINYHVWQSISFNPSLSEGSEANGPQHNAGHINGILIVMEDIWDNMGKNQIRNL